MRSAYAVDIRRRRWGEVLYPAHFINKGPSPAQPAQPSQPSPAEVEVGCRDLIVIMSTLEL